MAILEPLKFGGVTITRASLGSVTMVVEKDVRVGDMVVVGRAQDVIPEVGGWFGWVSW